MGDLESVKTGRPKFSYPGSVESLEHQPLQKPINRTPANATPKPIVAKPGAKPVENEGDDIATLSGGRYAKEIYRDENRTPYTDSPYRPLTLKQKGFVKCTQCGLTGPTHNGSCNACGFKVKESVTEATSYWSGSPTDTTRLHGSIRIKVLDESNFAVRAPDRIIDQVAAYRFFEQFQILLPRTAMLNANTMFRISEWWKNFAKRGDILEIDCTTGFATVMNETTGNFYAIGHFGNAPDLLPA